MTESEFRDIEDLQVRLVSRARAAQRLAEKSAKAGNRENQAHFAGLAHGFREAARMAGGLIGEIEEVSGV